MRAALVLLGARLLAPAAATPVDPLAALACALRHSPVDALAFHDLGCYCGASSSVAKRGDPLDESDACCMAYDVCAEPHACLSTNTTYDAVCIDDDDVVSCVDEGEPCCACAREFARCIRQAVEFHDAGHFAALVDVSDPNDDSVCAPGADREKVARRHDVMDRVDLVDSLEGAAVIWEKAKLARATWKEAAIAAKAGDGGSFVDAEAQAAAADIAGVVRAELAASRDAIRAHVADAIRDVAERVHD